MRDRAHDHDALWATVQENARAVRAMEHGLARSTELEPYLKHAANVVRLTDALGVVGLPIKATFSAARLNYQLARQAVTLAETVERFEETRPEVRSLGPSLVLLLNEAERRFEREGRSDQLPDLVRDLAAGASRRALREKYLPPRRAGRAAVFAALEAGCVPDAKRAFAECDPVEQGRLRRFAHMLARIVGAHAPTPAVPVGSTIEEAVTVAVEARDVAGDESVAPCNPNTLPNGG